MKDFLTGSEKARAKVLTSWAMEDLQAVMNEVSEDNVGAVYYLLEKLEGIKMNINSLIAMCEEEQK